MCLFKGNTSILKLCFSMERRDVAPTFLSTLNCATKWCNGSERRGRIAFAPSADFASRLLYWLSSRLCLRLTIPFVQVGPCIFHGVVPVAAADEFIIIVAMLEELPIILNTARGCLGNGRFVHNVLKDEDFTLVSRLTLSDGTTRIIKACRPPLDAEVALYRNFRNLGGLAPGCMFSEMVRPDLGVMLLEDIPGNRLRERFNQEDLQSALIEILNVHFRFAGVQAAALPSFSHLDLMPSFDCFAENARRLAEGPLPEIGEIRSCMHAISRILQKYPATLVHGDLFHDNIICTRTRIRIIDWSFAHLGIGLSDVASVLCNDERKNSGNRSFEDQAGIYDRVLSRCRIRRRPPLTLEQELSLGNVLMDLRFANWMITRMLAGKWRYSALKESIRVKLDTLLKRCVTAVERV